MSADQLLAKALSTDSEDEAIACLKMARKKNLKISTAEDGHTVESRTNQLIRLLEMYNNLRQDHYTLTNKFNEHEHENVMHVSELKKQIKWAYKTAVIGVMLSIMITATFMNSIANHRVQAMEAEYNKMELAPCSGISCKIGRSLAK
jgi:hypothetical protein